MKAKESEKRDKYQDLAREQRKIIEYEGDGDTNCGECTWNNPLTIVTGTGKIVGRTRFFSLGVPTSLGERKL